MVVPDPFSSFVGVRALADMNEEQARRCGGNESQIRNLHNVSLRFYGDRPRIYCKRTTMNFPHGMTRV